MDWTNILGPDPAAGIGVIFMLILIEGILSVDNAAVLATMVMKLPPEQRSKALKYGIFGAYFFRGLCLIFAFWLMKIWWLEPVGGLYLLYLAVKHFAKKEHVEDEAREAVADEGNWLYKKTLGLLGPFWSTVIAVEIMDLAFSLDNVMAAVAYVQSFPAPSKYVLVCTGVFIGILTMRFAAQGFVKLMHRYPFLETSAFLVIGLLGLKLLCAIPKHYLADGHAVKNFLLDHKFDLISSSLTVLIFLLPVATCHFFGWPKKTKD